MKKYKEDKNSIFFDNGLSFSINKILKIVENKQIYIININQLSWIFIDTNIEWDRVKDANLKYPIIITRENNEFVVVDGIHRLYKAFKLGIHKIRAKLITRKELKSCIVN